MAESIDVNVVLDDIRYHAEIMAKGKEAERNQAYREARRWLEGLEEHCHQGGAWDTAYVADKLAALKEQLASLAHLDGTQAAALVAQWNWVGAAIQAVEEGFKIKQGATE
jgi:alkylhydroperoxidase family enzyme